MDLSGRRVYTVLSVGVRGVLALCVFAVSLIIPRDDSVWVFGSNGGGAFRDNSKYLYLHTVEERSHLRAVWLSRNSAIVEALQESGYEAYHVNSLRGMWLNLRAGYVFITHGMPDVNRWCSGGATKVLLWHGVALKRIGWDDPGLRRVMDKMVQRLKDKIFHRYDIIVVPTDAMREPFSSAFRVNPEKILVAGYPRNDVLTNSWTGYDPLEDTARIDSVKTLYRNGAVLLYMPTKRRETSQEVADHLDFDELDQWLANRDAYMLFKPHPSEPIVLRDTHSRIIEVSSAADIYPLLKYTDVLLTDYSSIYFDYLLLDRPVVFYPFDIEEYRSERGFYLDYEEATPGPIATDFDGLLRSLDDALENDGYATERKSVRERYIDSGRVSRCNRILNEFDPLT